MWGKNYRASRREVQMMMVVTGAAFMMSLFLLNAQRECVTKLGQGNGDMSELTKERDGLVAQLTYERQTIASLQNQLNLARPDAPPIDPYSATASGSSVIPVVVFTHARKQYLEKTLDTLLERRPPCCFPVYVSQDGNDNDVGNLLEHRYGSQVVHLKHLDNSGKTAYHKIANHYGWLLNQIFEVMLYEQVILLEEDIEIAPDFFSYFGATLPLLHRDPTLFCVSAWNDNGHKEFVGDPTRLYRSDFFPGLGWMLTRSLWTELKSTWPPGYWDDYLREPPQRKERACIRPEVSRTFTFGESGGASSGQFYSQHLAKIKLNDQPVDWMSEDLSALIDANQYKVAQNNLVENAVLVSVEELRKAGSDWPSVIGGTAAKVEWTNPNDFAKIARIVGVMDDLKAGVPRTGYDGVVDVPHWKGARLYIVRSPRAWQPPKLL